MKLKDIQNFVEGYYNYAQDKLEPHIQEQVDLRAYLCSPCLQRGKCDMCGCKTPPMFYAPKKQDSRGRWAEFFSQTQWEALKNNIDLYKSYFDELKRRESDELRGGASSDEGSTPIAA